MTGFVSWYLKKRFKDYELWVKRIHLNEPIHIIAHIIAITLLIGVPAITIYFAYKILVDPGEWIFYDLVISIAGTILTYKIYTFEV